MKGMIFLPLKTLIRATVNWYDVTKASAEKLTFWDQKFEKGRSLRTLI